MNLEIPSEDLAQRFMRYVQVDTQSDPNSNEYPTTEKQKDLGHILAEELRMMGVLDAELDEFGYVYATIPANSSKKDIPVICFCSHVDTAPDCSGKQVKPILHRNYFGESIVLPDDATQVLHKGISPYLEKHIGSDIITASGTTLLGADDKAGVSIIMQTVRYLMEHPEIKHGTIRILFTPDEEVGKGTAKLDLKKLDADYGYTLDGGEAGCLEDETFSADGAVIHVHGVIAHPGYAKDRLINALKIASEIIDSLPKNEWSPETTDKRNGFVHPVAIHGIAEKATIEFIVRDFKTAELKSHHDRLETIAKNIVSKYPGCSIEYIRKEQYRNMKEILDLHPNSVRFAANAIERTGLSVTTESIRGGTDGSRLSFMGLPCPNLFTGMQQIHSKLEWVAVKDMVKSVETLLHLSMIWEEEAIG